MKKCFFILFLCIGLGYGNAQKVGFGMTGGYLQTSVVTKYQLREVVGKQEVKFTDSDNSVYLGVLVDIPFSDALAMQTEFLFLNDAFDSDFLKLPMSLKYFPVERFYLLGGPQLTYTLDEKREIFKKLNFGVGAGFGFDINESMFIQTRYNLQLNNYVKESDSRNGSASTRLNFLTFGFGYKFH